MAVNNPPSNDSGPAITATAPLIRRDQDGKPIYSLDYKGNVRRSGIIGKIY